MTKTLPFSSFVFLKTKQPVRASSRIAPPFFLRGARERGGQARKFLPHTPSFPRLPAELTFLLEMGSRYIQYFPPDCKRPPFEVVFL